MFPDSGDSLAGAEVAAAIVERLFPLATVVTPNIPEASVMLGARHVCRLHCCGGIAIPPSSAVSVGCWSRSSRSLLDARTARQH